MDLSLVRELEEISARAWPPLDRRDVDGWLLRAGGGVTGRANSVWPRADHGAMTIDAKLAAAAEFYDRHELPLLVQLTPTSQPAGLAAELGSRGFAVTKAARSVQVAPLPSVVAIGDAARARVEDTYDRDWYAVVAQVNPSFDVHRSAARSLLAGVGRPSAFVTATVDGVVAAAGRGVLDGDWLGLFNMATLPAYRRQGLAASVLAAIAQWAAEGGATRAYLQLEADNEAAPRLYAKAGFAHCYDYTFWGQPSRPTVIGP